MPLAIIDTKIAKITTSLHQSVKITHHCSPKVWPVRPSHSVYARRQEKEKAYCRIWVAAACHGDHCLWSYFSCYSPCFTCPLAASWRRELRYWTSGLPWYEHGLSSEANPPWQGLIHGERIMMIAARGSVWNATVAPNECLILTFILYVTRYLQRMLVFKLDSVFCIPWASCARDSLRTVCVCSCFLFY